MARKRHVESSPTEQLSASLKALPADTAPGVSLGVEGSGCGSSGGQAHWTINDPKRVPSKKVSLKLSKVGPASQSSTRSSPSPLRPARASSADVAALSCGGSAGLKKGMRFAPDSANDDGWQPDSIASVSTTPSLCSTAPAVCNRPPVPPGPAAKPGPARPSSSGQKPLGRTKEEQEEIIVDEGRVYAPRVAAPLNVLPASRPSSAASVASGIEQSVLTGPLRGKQGRIAEDVQLMQEVPAFPRIAWGDAPPQDGVHSIPQSDLLEMESQLHRDFLASQLEEEERTETATNPEQKGKAARHALVTKESQASLLELEQKLGEAATRAEASRKELCSYLTDLRERRFEEPNQEAAAAASSEAEPLVSMPEDFEDICDLTLQMSAYQRRRKTISGQPSTSDDKGGSAFQLPSFLEKYFFEEKATEEFPHLQLQAVATSVTTSPADGGGGESRPKRSDAVGKGLEQIARLDTLLLKREAAAQARRTAAEVELQATKNRLQREAEAATQQTEAKLQKLKAKGFLRNSKGAASASSSKRTSVSSTQVSVVSHAVTPAAGSAHGLVRSQLSPVDWSQWTSSAPAAEDTFFSRTDTPVDSAVARTETPEEDVEDADTTFLLTSMTQAADLLHTNHKNDKMPVVEECEEDLLETVDTEEEHISFDDHRLQEIDAKLKELAASQLALGAPEKVESALVPQLHSDVLERLLAQAARDTAAETGLALTHAAPSGLEDLPQAVEIPSLRKANEILERISNSEALCLDALGDVDYATTELEADILGFEHLVSSAKEKPEDHSEPEAPKQPNTGFSTVTERLERLREEVACIIEREEPRAELLERLRREAAEDAEEPDIDIPDDLDLSEDETLTFVEGGIDDLHYDSEQDTTS